MNSGCPRTAFDARVVGAVIVIVPRGEGLLSVKPPANDGAEVVRIGGVGAVQVRLTSADPMMLWIWQLMLPDVPATARNDPGTGFTSGLPSVAA